MVATDLPASPSGQTDILSYLLGHALQTPDKTFVQAELPDSRDRITYARAWRDLIRCNAICHVDDVHRQHDMPIQSHGRSRVTW